jgi:hypothetical protein
MGCNCGGTKKKPTTYVHTNPTTGVQSTYSTMIEAKAAATRSGGGPIREVQNA